MLRKSREKRSLQSNLMLASSTAFVSGTTNVAGVIAFLAFTTNITGHVALLARKVNAKDVNEIITVFLWVFMFFMGAFISHFLVRSFERTSRYKAHALPIIIEVIVLLVVAVYGNHFFNGTDGEREVIIGSILFAMGLQNSLVSTISGGLIKSSHLTGLFTDIGADLAEWFHPLTEKTLAVKNRIYIRLTVLGFYFIGGVVGGFLFELYDFKVFYFIPLVLLTILFYDISTVTINRIGHRMSTRSQTE